MYNLHLNDTDAEAVFTVVLFVTVFTEFGFTKRVDRITTAKVFENLTFRALALRQSEIPADEGLKFKMSQLPNLSGWQFDLYQLVK